MAETLIKQGANIYSKVNNRRTILYYIALNLNIDIIIIKLLLKKEVEELINTKDNRG